jgi:hypothetical protein
MSGELVVVDLIRDALGFKPSEIPHATDWAKVQELSLRHRVAPLIPAVSTSAVPDKVLSWASSMAISATQHSIQAKRVLVRVRERFDMVGVRALLFKGVALQEWAYRCLVRASADIDILVEPHAIAAAAEELRGLGFQKHKSDSTSCGLNDSVGVWRDAVGNAIDLHVVAIEPYVYPFPDFAQLWRNQKEMPALSCPFLGPAHHMLLLLLHGSKHQWCRLSWIVDVAVTAQKLGKDEWQQVFDIAQEIQASRAVSVGLLLCCKFFDVRATLLESGVLSAVSPQVEAIATAYSRRLFTPFSNTTRVKLANSILHLRTFESMRQQARYVATRFNRAVVRHTARGVYTARSRAQGS